MKKTILLVILAVIVATPCLAQEIEPDGLFSIEGTEWRCIGLAFLNKAPFIMPIDYTTSFSAYDHYDFLLFSFALGLIQVDRFAGRGPMILQPTIGVGVFTSVLVRSLGVGFAIEFVGVGFGYMFKIADDDWPPPEVQ